MTSRVPLLSTFKLLGMAGVASYALARFTMRLRVVSWNRAFVVAVPRAGMPDMPRGFAVREIAARELSHWTIDVTPKERDARFSQGLICLGAFNREGELTGLVWMTDKGCTEGDVALFSKPPADGAWDTGMWIHPDHRLGRSFQALWAGVSEWLAVRGLSASYSAIADYNVNSLGSHRRLGMVKLGLIQALRIGRWQWIAAGTGSWHRVPPGRHISWQVPSMMGAHNDAEPRSVQSPSIAA